MRLQRDAVAGNRMPDRGDGFGPREMKSRAVCRGNALRPGLPRANLDVGEFPQVGVHDAGGALADEKLSAAFDHEGDEISSGCRFAFAPPRKFFLPTAATRDAEAIDGTPLAARRARRADERAEFHEGLIEARARGCVMPVLRGTVERGRAACGVMNQILRDSPESCVGLLFARIGRDAEDASQDANHISVEDGARLVEGDAGNCPGGVAPDAGQLEDVVEIFREPARVLRDDLPRRALQIADSRVIAEPFPKFVELAGRRLGGGSNRRELAHPACPIRDDGFHLRLLEHDFGNPDGVGVTRATPGQVASVGGKPRKQQRNELFNFRDWLRGHSVETTKYTKYTKSERGKVRWRRKWRQVFGAPGDLLFNSHSSAGHSPDFPLIGQKAAECLARECRALLKNFVSLAPLCGY